MNLPNYKNKKGVRHETSAPHTPEQNGVSERANRTVVEAARSMLHAKNLGVSNWSFIDVLVEPVISIYKIKVKNQNPKGKTETQK